MHDPGRLVTLVLVRPDGGLVGSLPPFPVDTPWWQDAESVVRAAREAHGARVTVLRLLEADRPMPHGGSVTYLAEVLGDIVAQPWNGRLDDHPLRLPYARPAGPAADLAWAEALLAERGMRLIGPAEQVRTWNLSSLWRLRVAGQVVWLKVVPRFFAHEGPMLERLHDQAVPDLIAHEGGRVLLAEIPGADLYDPSLAQMLDMVALLVGIQQKWISRADELLALGLPDWRAPALSAAIRSVMQRVASELDADDRSTLQRFAAGLNDRFGAVRACGLPDTLVHGDFHPGNVRGDVTRLVLLDWGDCGIGHPLLDESAFRDRIPAHVVASVGERWHAEWRRAVPGSDPQRASALLAPVAAARQAVTYQGFLDGIEPSEHPYHRQDPAERLRRTAALARAES